MKQPKMKPMKTIIKTGDAKSFFERGMKLAKALDAKKKITSRRRIISFEDPAHLVSFLTKAKSALLVVP